MAIETMDTSLSFEEQIDEDLSQLKQKIPTTKDEVQEDAMYPQDTLHPVEKIWKNKVKFPYTSSDHECTLILEKKWNKIFAKLEKLPTYMGNPLVNEFKKPEKSQWLLPKEIPATSQDAFMKWLWKALDDIIGTWRVSAADKAEEAYKLLWFTIN